MSCASAAAGAGQSAQSLRSASAAGAGERGSALPAARMQARASSAAPPSDTELSHDA